VVGLAAGLSLSFFEVLGSGTPAAANFAVASIAVNASKPAAAATGAAAPAGAGAGAGGALVTEYPHIKAVTAALDCQNTLLPARNMSDALLYMEGRIPLVLDPASKGIMAWITGNEGERAVHDVFTRLFSEGCAPAGAAAGGKAPGLFLDVGANAGFYSLIAAAYGCQVLAFDPQKVCSDLVRRNFCLNPGLPGVAGRRVAVVNAPVSDVATTLNLSVPAACEGVFFVPWKNDTPPRVPVAETYQRASVSLDGLLLKETSAEVFVLKIDTEGYELPVMKSISGLLAARRVRHILVEVTPVFWTRDGVPRADIYAAFLPLLGYGCRIQRVLDIAANSTALLDTAEKLREYLVVRDYIQEDVLVTCPPA
jgi:FkbM family methyltransferase